MAHRRRASRFLDNVSSRCCVCREVIVNIELALLSDYAATTSDGKLIAAGIFDQLTPPRLPWQHPTMFISLRVHYHPGEEGQHNLKVRLVNPDGAEVVALDTETEIGGMDPVEGAGFQLVFSLNNVTFNTHGRHAFDIFLDGRYEHTVPLSVVVRDAESERSQGN